MAEQLFYGRISGVTPQGNSSNSYIRLRGDFVSGTNTMTNIVDQSGFLPLEFVKAGQMLRASGPYTFGVTITDVDVSGRTITLETNAADTRTNSLARIAPGAGEYFIESASLQDPQQLVDYSDITGSDDSNYFSVSSSRYAVLGKAYRDGATVPGRFHLYEIKNVHGRNGGNNIANLYIQFAESGSEADSGDTLVDSSNQNLAIIELSSQNGLGAIFKSGLVSNFSLEDGEEFAAYQLALSDFLDNIQTGSGDSSESASYATTASYAETASILLGSVESASFATTASHALNASAESSSYATTASYALNALTASYAVSSSHEIVTEVTSSFATTASFAFAAETLLGTVETASNANTASILENTLKFGDGLGGTEFNGRIDVTASIDTGSSHFQTGSKTAIESFPDLRISGSILGTASFATTASHALNASAESASFATTASYAHSSSVAVTASFVAVAMSALDADFAMTASYVEGSNVDGTVTSASYALTASHALNATAESSSYATTASHALTASYFEGEIESASFATTASYVDIASTERFDFSSTASITVNHSLESEDVLIQAYETNGGTHLQSIPEDVEILSDSQVKVTFAVVTSGYVVVGRGGFLRGGVQDSASFATTSSHALTASYALNAGGGSGEGFPYTGSAFVTGSLNVTGSVNILSGSLTINSGSITADNFNVGEAAVGNPVVSASATLTLYGGNAVAVTGGPLRLPQFDNDDTGSIVGQDGDLIWNTDRAAFMGYSGSDWHELSLV